MKTPMPCVPALAFLRVHGSVVTCSAARTCSRSAICKQLISNLCGVRDSILTQPVTVTAVTQSLTSYVHRRGSACCHQSSKTLQTEREGGREPARGPGRSTAARTIANTPSSVVFRADASGKRAEAPDTYMLITCAGSALARGGNEEPGVRGVKRCRNTHVVRADIVAVGELQLGELANKDGELCVHFIQRRSVPRNTLSCSRLGCNTLDNVSVSPCCYSTPFLFSVMIFLFFFGRQGTSPPFRFQTANSLWSVVWV